MQGLVARRQIWGAEADEVLRQIGTSSELPRARHFATFAGLIRARRVWVVILL